MKDKLLRRAQREYSPKRRLLALSVEVAVFLGVLPVALVTLSSSLDLWLHLPRLGCGPINTVIGCLSILAGFILGLWTVYVQFTVGRGTPAPVMATQKLIVRGPYEYCRNPMTLGTIVLYLGIAILIGSLSAVGLVALGAASLLVYVKLIEEKELEARFGQEYLEYKQRTPFLFPHFWKGS